MLQEYSAFLAGAPLDEVADAYAAALKAKGLPILRLGGEVSDDRLLARCKKTLATVLGHLAEGQADAWIAERSRALREDPMPGIRQDDLTTQDVLSVLEAQKVALLRLMPRFTRDPEAVAMLAVEIDDVYSRAKLDVFEAYAEIRDRLAQSVRLAHEQLAEAQSLAHIGSWEWDVVTDTITWSDELYRIFGLERAAFEATYESYLARVHPDDRDRLDAVIQAAFRDRVPYAVEHRTIRPDGSVCWILGIGKVVLDGDGNVVRLAGVAQDITERKWSEEALGRYTADLEAANAHLKDLDRLKDDFLAIVSHELRTPLNFIMGFSSVLEEGIGGSLSGQQVDFVNRIFEGAKRMQRLVDNLLQMARLRAGKFDLVFESVDLAHVVADVVGNLARAAEVRKIALSADAPEQSPMVGDSHRIFQVLVNLVENALKFTNTGGSVVIAVRRQRDGYRVEVRDTGCGIAAEDIPKLFQRFGQLDMSATRVAGGTGLGLSIAKSLVEAHGGAIGVGSKPGAGSTFWFFLPAQPPSHQGDTVTAEWAVSP